MLSLSRQVVAGIRDLPVPRHRPLGVRLAIGLGATVLGLAARAPIAGALGEQAPFLTFYPAIALAAWAAGSGAGLVATVTSAVLAATLYLPPTGSLAVDDVIVLVVYVLAGILIAALGGQLHRSIATTRDRNEELAAVIEVMDDPVILADELGRIRSVNPVAARLLGPVNPDTLDGILEELRPVPGRTDARRLPGAHRSVVPRILDIDGGRRGRIAVLRDVTEILETEAARDAFLGMLSHELRTPITTIYGNAHMLQRPLDDETRSVLTADLGMETDRLYRLVEDLLVLSRFERGRLDIVPEPVLVERVIARVLAREGERWPSMRIGMTVDGETGPVLADATYVEQVVRNLLSNIAKYAGPAADVAIRIQAEGPMLRVAIEDDGPGIPEREQERIFQLYERLDERRDPMTPGAGIGLFVCRRLVETMGGTMHVQRGGRGGACFVFTLPRESAAGDDQV